MFHVSRTMTMCAVVTRKNRAMRACRLPAHAPVPIPIADSPVLSLIRSARRTQTMNLYKRVSVSLFGDPTKIVRAPGLDIELPDPDRVEPAYWKRAHAEGWKQRLVGKIAGPEMNDDPDWCRLLRFDFAEVRSDLAEGIKFWTEIQNLPRVMDLAYRLCDFGIPLKDEDGTWLVHATPTVLMDRPEFDAEMRAAGLVQHEKYAIRWEPPPHWDQQRKRSDDHGETI
jgi:hypothetical protein